MNRIYRICFFLVLFGLIVFMLGGRQVGDVVAQDEVGVHTIRPGDTWTALTFHYGVAEEDLRTLNPHPNPLRQPVIGDTVMVPAGAVAQNGVLWRGNDGGLLRQAAHTGQNVWQMATELEMPHPYRPLFYRPLFFPGGEFTPLDLPIGFTSLELSTRLAQPGRALAFRGLVADEVTVTAKLGEIPFNSFGQSGRVIGIGGTGAFFPAGAHSFLIAPEEGPAWTQPWRFMDGEWDFDRVTLTGDAAAIDQAAITEERARLQEIWSQVSPQPLWSNNFTLPVDNFLEVSSKYGARRSYNGGPFRTYHEGVDFSAYGGTPVFAPAGGTVVLAENLYVRGGAVIIDHGLGIFSGYYHLSNVIATPGQVVGAGTILGEVGTTGLSSGNHLHWDLLVAGNWVDVAAWQEQNMACWILEGWGSTCLDIQSN
jgi:murein DD-endopeptidase MepM/ murein hydrolase activator NlpD